MYFFVNLIVLLHGYFTGVDASNCFISAKDVCNGELPEIPYLSTRHPEFSMTSETSHSKMCDVYAVNTSKWYKSERRMTTTCPRMYMCGAKYPIWLNGKNPEPSEGVVHRTACLRDFDSCCLDSYDLTAVNCGEFMAYCLVDLPSSCHQRYCFDKGQVSTTEPQQTTTNDFKTSTSADTTTLKYSSTTQHDSTTASSAGVIDTSTSAAPTDDNNLHTIALSVTGFITAVIFGLLIFIIRRRRVSNVTEETNKGKEYDTLKLPDVNKVNADERENEYRNVTFSNPGVTAEVESKIGKYNNGIQTYKTCFADVDYQLTTTEKELYNDEDRYLTLP